MSRGYFRAGAEGCSELSVLTELTASIFSPVSLLLGTLHSQVSPDLAHTQGLLSWYEYTSKRKKKKKDANFWYLSVEEKHVLCEEQLLRYV